jgi:hypothetical protein
MRVGILFMHLFYMQAPSCRFCSWNAFSPPTSNVLSLQQISKEEK